MVILSAIKSTIFFKWEIRYRIEIKTWNYFNFTFHASLGNFQFDK